MIVCLCVVRTATYDATPLCPFGFNDSVGGGWGVCLHHPRGRGHRLPAANTPCPRIPVNSIYCCSGNLISETFGLLMCHDTNWVMLCLLWFVWNGERRMKTHCHMSRMDSIYCISLNATCFHRLPQSMTEDSHGLSRITFVFDTTCTANCKFYFLAVRDHDSHNTSSGCAHAPWGEVKLGLSVNFLWWSECLSLQGYSKYSNDLVEQWTGSNKKQSYSYLIQKNSTTSFIWTFQRTQEVSTVRLTALHQHPSLSPKAQF